MELGQRIAELEARLEVALADNTRLRAENAALRVWVAELESRLGKNSSNSSMPPLRDDAEARAERAKRAPQRPRTGRKPGGQAGRRGTTMSRIEHPDRTVTHRPVDCGGCGAGLDRAVEVGRRVCRQVFDVVEAPRWK